MSSEIVVGYDGSTCARAALRAAIEVAGAYGDTLVVAFGYRLSPVGGELHDFHQALRELAGARLQEATELAAADGVEVETVIVEQDPAPALVELAAQRGARLIVVGTHGESPIKGALVGSTPHKLLQLSDRPVLVVPDGA